MFSHVTKALYNLIEGIVKRMVNAIIVAPVGTSVWVLAVLGGFAAVGSWVGTFIGFLVNIGPWWTPYPLFLVALIAVIADIAREGVAERFAIYGSLVVPSFAMAIPKDGKLHGLLAGWVDTVNHWLDKHIGEWIGHAGQNAVLTVVTVCAIAVAIYYCEKIAKAKGVSRITASGGASPARRGPAARTAARP